MNAKLFESALRITDPWLIEFVKFGEAAKTLTSTCRPLSSRASPNIYPTPALRLTNFTSLNTPACGEKMRWIEQKTDKALKVMRWTLLKDTAKLRPEAAADLDALIAKISVKRTARAWFYK